MERRVRLDVLRSFRAQTFDHRTSARKIQEELSERFLAEHERLAWRHSNDRDSRGGVRQHAELATKIAGDQPAQRLRAIALPYLERLAAHEEIELRDAVRTHRARK